MRKTLVVYFSRSGRTRRIAEEIASTCGAHIEGIREANGRSGVWGYLRSVRDALSKRVVEIEPPTHSPEAYDLVILGTPVWAGSLSAPLRTYVDAYSGCFRNVAFFCTQGGSGAEQVFAEMAQLCGKAPVASVAISEAEIQKDRYAGKLARFSETFSPAQAA